MRKKPKLDLGLNAYEELFMNENERIEAMRALISHTRRTKGSI